MDGFVDRLHALRFLRACDPSYRSLTFFLVGLLPTEHISLFLDIPCHRHYPGRFNGACSLVFLHCQRPSLCKSPVGSCNCFFEACSAFTHVMACTLAESPSDPLHRRLRQLRCLRCRFDCYRVERTSSRAGVTPAEVQRLSRRTFSPIERLPTRFSRMTSCLPTIRPEPSARAIKAAAFVKC
jgi:hypothetical protein